MDRYQAFHQLHESNEPFILPNPWDIGSARLLKAAGFKAMGSTSGGHAYMSGQCDHATSEKQILQHCKMLVDATDLPVTGDLGKGFGDSPASVASTIEQAAEIGLAGCSIEDFTGDPNKPIFDFSLSVERIAAACEARDKLEHDFILTARCDNYARGITDFDETMDRLKAFEQAGADVLYAPGMTDLDEVKLCCSELSNPVNLLLECLPPTMAIQDIKDAGVRRMSTGSGFYLAAMGGFMSAIDEVNNAGTLNFISDTADYAILEDTFSRY